MSEKYEDYVTLKWGTLKSWKLSNPKLEPLIEEYNQEGGISLSAMTQHDTPRQKEIICEIIQIIGNPVYSHWSGEYLSVDDAKEYIMDYGKK